MGELILYNNQFQSSYINVPVSSPHFQYGQGFFETLLYEKGLVFFLDEHLDRIKKTCDFFNISLDLSWLTSERIQDLILENNLKANSVRVKILYAPIKRSDEWDVCIWALPYERENRPRSLCVHREIRDSIIYGFKSTNYHANLFWKQHYKDKADEVLFLNKDRKILEGSLTNLIYIKKGSLCFSGEHNSYLKGITQEKILEAAVKAGLDIQAKNCGIDPEEVKTAQEVMVLNSLIIAQSCSCLIDENEKKYKLESMGWAEAFRDKILQDDSEALSRLANKLS